MHSVLDSRLSIFAHTLSCIINHFMFCFEFLSHVVHAHVDFNK